MAAGGSFRACELAARPLAPVSNIAPVAPRMLNSTAHMAPTTTSSTEAKSPNKSDFIRAQPATMSAAEVVEKAKAEGIDLRAGLVYEVRRTDKARKRGTTKRASAVAKKGSSRASFSKGASKGASPKTQQITNKAAFVRAHANLSPKEIVAKARAQNVKLDVGYVYNIRSSSRTANTKTVGRRPRGAAEHRGAAAAQPLAGASRVETLLKAVAAEVGLARAIEILRAERATIASAIRA